MNLSQNIKKLMELRSGSKTSSYSFFSSIRSSIFVLAFFPTHMIFAYESGQHPFYNDFSIPMTSIDRIPARIYENDESRAPLLDPEQRISPEFHVPKNLALRTQFWFDVYTKYNSDQHIVHHKEFPWIVFSVIDTRSFATEGGTLWTTFHRSKKFVQQKISLIRKTLKKLSRRKQYKKLTPLEKDLYNVLAKIKGSRQKVFREAYLNMRTQLGQRDFFIEALKTSTQYLTYMEELFASHNLPKELTRLPFVESSFNVKAESKVGASGIWQIMPATGSHYVTVTKYIDERNSPIKATRAAAQLLNSYHKRLENWPITITAYNHGIGGMRRAVRKSKTHDLGKIIEQYNDKSFGFASSNFYTSFLAALHAEKYADEIFSGDSINREKLQLFNSIRLAKKYKPKKIAKLTGIPIQKFQSYNLDLKKAIRKNVYLPKGLEIHLPPEANIDTLVKSSEIKLVSQYLKSESYANEKTLDPESNRYLQNGN